MKKLMLLLLVGATSAYGQTCGCDHTITTATSTVDGVTLNIQPGDVVCVEDGVRGRMKFRNISGTAADPVTIINCGGQVVMNPTSYSYGMKLENCDYVHFSGTGEPGLEYGFKIGTTTGYGLTIEKLSNHFEFDHFLIDDAGNYAIYSKNDPTCDLSANKGVFAQEDCSFHHINIINSHKGLRMGHPDYDLGYSHSTCGTLEPHGVENLIIHDMIIDNMTGGDGIRLYGSQATIYDNQISNVSGRGLTIGTHCDVKLERNSIMDSDDEGFRALGSGKYELYNNVFYNNGDATHEAIECAFEDAGTDPLGNVITFVHNTVLNSPNFNFSIIEPENATATCGIYNNIFGDPGFTGSSSSIHEPYLNIEDMTDFNVANNQFELDPADLDFVDYVNLDFHLTHESSAVNSGEQTFTTLDYDGQTRNLAGETDAGAFEYVPERIGYFEQIDLQGLYVNDFKYVLGDTEAENELLLYAANNGFNYLVLYNLTYINNNMYDLTDPAEAIVLADFIENAKRNYGIVQVAAVGEKDASFDKMEDYNDIYSGNWYQQVDVLNLEFEFWAKTSGSTFQYYCDTYLTPNGYPCTTTGAYDFYLDQLELIDARAITMGMVNEIYLGKMTDARAEELAENCDRILLHHYRKSDTYNNGNSIYNYKVDRIRAISLSTRQPAVMPIFSAMSYHMGPWLETHTIYEPMDTWYTGQNGYDADPLQSVQDLNIAGQQWYRYTELLDISLGRSKEGPGSEEGTEEALPIKNDADVKAYPSVFHHELNIEISDKEDANYQGILYDVNGRIVYQEQIIDSNHQMRVPELKRGMYFLVVQKDGLQIFSDKVVKS